MQDSKTGQKLEDDGRVAGPHKANNNLRNAQEASFCMKEHVGNAIVLARGHAIPNE